MGLVDNSKVITETPSQSKRIIKNLCLRIDSDSWSEIFDMKKKAEKPFKE